MNLPTLNLKTATPDEINAAVAIHVVGWTEVYAHGSGHCGDESALRGIHPATPDMGRREVPDYLTDANAVLPLLYRTHWEVNQTTNAAHPIRVVIYNSVVASAPRASGEANNLPRAACIALLRASGKVTVLD